MKKNIKVLTLSIIMCSLLITPICGIVSHAFTNRDEKQDIVDIAISDNRFTTLVEALKAADLVDTLKGEGPFTVFAPTNDAFSKLPEGTLEDLLKPENKDTLKDILLYHVNKEKICSKDLSKLDGKELTQANGKTVKISVKDGEIYINDSKIIISDIKASNGIIHVIDTVLIPKK